MTPEQARVIAEDVVRDLLGIDIGETVKIMQFHGNCSYKMLGIAVGEALRHSRFVLVDGSNVRTAGGTKVIWR